MSKTKKIMNVLVLVAWFLIASGVVFVLISAVQKEKNVVCKGVMVNIDEHNGYKMIDDVEILSSLWPEKKGSFPNGKTTASFDLYNLEKQIEKNPWVESANLYFDQLHVLNLMIKQKLALARVFDPAGNSYYLDSNFNLLPTKNSEVISLPVFTNFYINPIKASKEDSSVLERMISLSKFISADSLWNAQVESVNINIDGSFELFTQVGNQKIILGVRDDWNLMFQKLTSLYHQMLSTNKWVDYALIDLRFKDQVVCSLQDNSLPVSDSLALSNGMESLSEPLDSVLPKKDIQEKEAKKTTNHQTNKN
jgi:cell division protein FtsQ